MTEENNSKAEEKTKTEERELGEQPKEKTKTEERELGEQPKEKTKTVEEKENTTDKKLEEQPKISEETKESASQKEEKERTEAEKETRKEKAKGKKETPKVKQYEVVAKGVSLPISKKHSMYICSFINGKNIDTAINELSLVVKMKKPVPFKGEIPHRKGRIMSGRYPVKASSYFINLLKGLKGNAIVSGLDLEKTRVYIASANWASRPARSGSRSAKRTHVLLKAKEFAGVEGK